MNSRLTAMHPERFIGTRDDIAARITRQVALAAQSALSERAVFTMAIPGGSVADVCLPLIAGLDLPWEKVHVFWCDERAVPVESADSNAGAAFKLWHDTPLSRRAALHVMNGGAADFGKVVLDYTAELRLVSGPAPVLDVALLGIGEDGHVASLFPGHATVHEMERLVLLETNSPKPPATRLTLSLPLLAGARHVLFAAFGDGKADVIQQALENETSELPVALVIRNAGNPLVMLDAGAASRLQNRAH